MIKKLKLKLVFLSMFSLFVLLSLLISAMNIINFSSVAADADVVLSVLADNEGRFPEHKEPKDKKFGMQGLSPEAPYESRYFTVLLDENSNVIQTNTSKIMSVDTQKAIEYSETVVTRNNSKGFIDIYRYNITNDDSNTRITFLDCRKQLDAFYNFLYSSICMSAIGYIIVFVIIFFCSGRIIKPIAESYEKQKRFITDAGHEIKTPLTIINANTDILEAEVGSNESIDDIRTQTKRLTELTNDLVYLAKMEENSKLELIDIPLSDIVTEISDNFKGLAIYNGIDLEVNVEPLITIQGNVKAIEQLVGILLDNAIKYTAKDTTVKIRLQKRGKYAEVSVSNFSKDKIERDKINKVFDRFYRSDLSRNSDTGGHGIGLSIAKAITEKHSGKIFAEMSNDNVFKITVVLPL